MPLFQIDDGKIQRIKSTDFGKELEIQKLIESNLETIFNCRFVATEFSTGDIHSGRIDTLALSEDNNPVIIEYKNVASSELLNQSLYYLSWLKDHKGDFQIAVNKALGNIEVDWSETRVMCIAPEYKKFDLHAARVMGANIELWQFKRFENDFLSLDEIFRRTNIIENINYVGKNPVMVEAGRKAAVTRATATYAIEDHIVVLPNHLAESFNQLQEFIMGLGAVEETPKKNYIAYKTSQNFVCLETRKDKILLFLKLNSAEHSPLPPQARDVTKIGHFGTGDFEFVLKNENDLEDAKRYIKLSFEYIGG
jgi:predicted transport protein